MTEALKADAEVPESARDKVGVEEEGSRLAMKRWRASIWPAEKLELSTVGIGDEAEEDVTKCALDRPVDKSHLSQAMFEVETAVEVYHEEPNKSPLYV